MDENQKQRIAEGIKEEQRSGVPKWQTLINALPAAGDPAYETDPQICAELKELYDVCFMVWFRKEFLDGEAKEAGCQEEWEAYETCTKRRLEKLDIKVPEKPSSL
eukprot:CAMPEP_0119149008 /NCGR_PEP_ID=MMETSP1310-20130426/42725_1 /TAXON_ID=464262 /ORGANISM="Genus nov. species nov., Strain RCC2339" /LENGTH=104 /DNA_ID=CAMNT_0007141083 /DNA_START=90 /DNA_END=404 /DNA_ORIENTATION=+